MHPSMTCIAHWEAPMDQQLVSLSSWAPMHAGYQALYTQHQHGIRPSRSLGRTPAARAMQGMAVHEQASSSGRDELAPWLLGFQCNERLLQWDDSAQVQLLKIYVARELGRDVGWVEEQLNVLRAVLPDMVGQVHRMKASLLLGLVRDTQEIADKMVGLKALLPGVDASRLVHRCPSLVLFHDTAKLEGNLHNMRARLKGADVEGLVDREPLMLLADVEFLLGEAERLLPAGHDPVAYLVANPSTLLDMQQAGLDSAIDGNLWTADGL